MTPSLTVHHLQVGQGERILWLLEELSIPYNLKLYQRDPFFSPPSLEALHPIGAAPVLEDATSNPENPLLLAETGAITEYVIHKYGNGRFALPPTHSSYADYLFWFHFANGTLQPTLFRRLGLRAVIQDETHPRFQMTTERIDRALAHVNSRLLENTWLAGDEFTAADIMSVWAFTTSRKFEPFDLSAYQGIQAWLKRCTDRSAYRAALPKGDPDLVIEELICAEGPSRFGAFTSQAKK